MILKEYEIKIGDFAKILKTTRPTLNNYIVIFESGDKIPNQKYQFIFKKLFKDGIETKGEFEKALERFHNLLKRDEALGVKNFDVEKTNLMSRIYGNIRRDLEKGDYDEDVYIFINYMLGSYRSEKIFAELAKYFIYLNGLKDVKYIKKDEKSFFANCFRVMSREKNCSLNHEEEDYEAFLSRAKEIKEANDKRKEERKKETIKKLIEEELNRKIQEELEIGVNIEDVDIEEIMMELGIKKND